MAQYGAGVALQSRALERCAKLESRYGAAHAVEGCAASYAEQPGAK